MGGFAHIYLRNFTKDFLVAEGTDFFSPASALVIKRFFGLRVVGSIAGSPMDVRNLYSWVGGNLKKVF